MKRSLLVVSILIVVLGVAGYFSYRYVFLQEKMPIFSLVPENALLIYETNDLGEDWDNLQGQELWTSIERVPALEKAKTDITLLDSLLGLGGINGFFDGRPLVISMHTTSKDEFDFLYVTELPDLEDQKKLNDIISRLEEEASLTVQTRHFNGLEINELQQKGSKKTFTYIVFKNYLIGSFATILVEDVVRNINADFTTSFLPKKRNADSLSGVDTGSGKLYLNLQKLGDFLSIFSSGTGVENNMINSFGEVALLEVNFKEGDLLLNGFSGAGNFSNNTWLETFEGIKPQPFGMADIVPDRTALLHHVTFDNPVKWNENLIRYWRSRNPAQLDRRDKLIDELGLNLDEFFPHVGAELGVATLESLEITTPDRLAFIETSDLDEALFVLENIAFHANKALGDTVFKEAYSGIEIVEIPLPQFPATLFGSVFKGFESSFYMPLGRYIVIGNSVEVLKGLLDDIEQEDTWGKSIKYNEFLGQTITEANYSAIINVPRVWRIFLNELSPKWKEFMETNSVSMKSLELMEFQFSNIENDFYTSVSYAHNNVNALQAEPARLRNVSTLYLEEQITSRPFVLKGSEKDKFEVIVQDSAQWIYSLSPEGRVLWKDSIDGKIVGDVMQIDYFNNGNLQLLLATDKSLYIIDREGNPIAGYPITPGFTIDQVNVIDYDKSKNYRFLLSDDAGNLYMFDKSAKNLDGWNPKTMEGPLALPPDHVRVRAKDILFALEQRGVLKAMTRRGEYYPGFPLSLEDKIISPLFLEMGASFGQTKFTVVTANGMVIQGNFEGEILRKNQLYKPSAATSFKLIPASSGKSFLILRQDLRRIAILNKNGEVLFEKDYLSSEEMDAQYYSFGTERNFVAITDNSQDFTYLYDISGNLINDQPLQSDTQIEMRYSESDSKFYVYRVYESEFSLDAF